MAPYTQPADAVWFITGCSSGIGLTLATYLLTHTSCRVVATARKPSTLESLPTSDKLLKLALDVTSEESIQAALKATISSFNRIDVLVNNAGYNILAEAETVSPSAAHTLMETNFWGAVRLTQLTLPIMREQNTTTGQQGGVILQMSSAGGRQAFAGNSFYHASKFALEGWTEAARKELSPDWNIHLCLIEPGGVKTNYASTSIATPASTVVHEAYASPNSTTNLLRAYYESPQATANWAEPEDVVAAIHKIVNEGPFGDGEIPLRIPLGADSWALQKKGMEVGLQRLEKLQSFSWSTMKNAEAQLKSIEFLEL